MDVANLVEAYLDTTKLFDITHCNSVVDKVMLECSSEEQFVLFGKVLHGRHGWGVAAKHYIQIEQLKHRGADQEILKLALEGKMEHAKIRLKQYAEANALIERIHQIKTRIEELEEF